MLGWILLALLALWMAAAFAWACAWWLVMVCLGWLAICVITLATKFRRALRRALHRG